MSYKSTYYQLNRARLRAQQSAYYRKNKKKFQARSRTNGPRWSRKYQYGLTEEQFLTLITVQNNACAICQQLFNELRGACVDHDHGTGEVRGLLCRQCNSGIGMLKDSPRRLRRAYCYLGLSDGPVNQIRLALEVDRSYARWLTIKGLPE